VVPPATFRVGARDLVAKLKTFRYESERRLGAVVDYAQPEECRSVFLRRYFGQERPRRCGTCDRCRAIRAAATRAEIHSGMARHTMVGHEIRTLKFMTTSRRGTDPSRTFALSWRRSFRPLSSNRNESAATNRENRGQSGESTKKIGRSRDVLAVLPLRLRARQTSLQL
jgi:RecQ zinc-binding